MNKIGKLVSVLACLAVANMVFASGSEWLAVLSEGPKAVRKAVQNGLDVNESITSIRRTPLMLSASYCNWKTVQELLSAGANISAQDRDGRTALMYWVSSECKDETVLNVISLLSSDSINMQDSQGNVALMYAIELSNQDRARSRVRALNQAGARTDIFNNEGENVLIFAAKTDPEIARLLVRSSQELDRALIIASYLHNLPAVKGLLQVGANPNYRVTQQNGFNIEFNKEVIAFMPGNAAGFYGTFVADSLMAAAAAPIELGLNHGKEVVQTLLAGGARYHAEVLLNAVGYNRPDVLEGLLDNGVNIYDSVGSGNVKTVILSRGALPGSPLFYKDQQYRAKVVKLLINAGIGVDSREGAKRQTWLMNIVKDDDVCIGGSAVKALLEAGANKNLRDDDGKTAYDMAACSEYKNWLKPDNTNKQSGQRTMASRTANRKPSSARRK